MKKDAALEDLVDLGLFTRILCHEMNNILASQQGFLKLLERGAQDPETLARWKEEVVKANHGLQDLVKSVQSFVHGDHGEGSGFSPDCEEQTLSIIHAAVSRGAQIPFHSLSRILSTTSHQLIENDKTLGDWTLTEDTGPVANGLLESIRDGIKLLCFSITVQPNPTLMTELDQASRRILPTKEGSAREWRWALVMGLLRQSRAEIRVQQDIQAQDSEILKLQILIPTQH